MIINFISGFPVFPSPAEAMPFILKGSALLLLLKLTVLFQRKPKSLILYFAFLQASVLFCRVWNFFLQGHRLDYGTLLSNNEALHQELFFTFVLTPSLLE